MTSATNDHNYSIHFSYDNMGNQTSITDALGNTFVYEYNNIGKKIKITDPLNRVTINEYDGKGRTVIFEQFVARMVPCHVELLSRFLCVFVYE